MDYIPKKYDLPPSGKWPGRKEKRISPYLFSDEIALAVDVALAAGRPLLVSGPPGSGKTSLAPVMAEIKKWDFLRHTLTSRSQLEDLSADMDQMRRLSHAQLRGSHLRPEWAYQKPGLFWWAFDPESAKRRGGSEEEFEKLKRDFPDETELALHDDRGVPIRSDPDKGVVILLDEIDKAEPDVPNDLLEPLANRSFKPPITERVQARQDLELLVMITTNQERDLPRAFVRRCVILDLQEPEAKDKQQKLMNRLCLIAREHLAFEKQEARDDLIKGLAKTFSERYFEAKEKQQRLPGTSEFLDAVRASTELGFSPDHPRWQQLIRATLIKE